MSKENPENRQQNLLSFFQRMQKSSEPSKKRSLGEFLVDTKKKKQEKPIDLEEEIEEIESSDEEPLLKVENKKKSKNEKIETPKSEEKQEKASEPSQTVTEVDWWWRSDKGWEKYPPFLSKQIEEAYIQKKLKFRVDNQRFIDFHTMFQRRYDNISKVRPIRRGEPPLEENSNVSKHKKSNHTSSSTSSSYFGNKSGSLKSTHENEPKSEITSTEMSKKKNIGKANVKKLQEITSNSMARWYWRTDDAQWEPFEHSINDKIEEAHQSKKEHIIKVDDQRYVDLKRRVQTRYDNPNKIRAIKREEAKSLWCWLTDSGKWVNYPSSVIEKIEQAFLSREKAVKVDQERFIDLENMLQRRYDNNARQRYVKRVGPLPKFKSKTLTEEQKQRIERNKAAALKKKEAKMKTTSEGKEKESKQEDKKEEKMEEMEEIFLSDLSSDSDISDSDSEEFLRKKRKFYKCGNNFVVLSSIPTWSETLEKFGISKVSSAHFHPSSSINSKVSLWKGDITSLEIESIVNAAKPSLMGGGGIDGAIHKAAGHKLLRECMLLDGCEVGKAKITGGHKLPARYVV